jgi:hypothetical protein
MVSDRTSKKVVEGENSPVLLERRIGNMEKQVIDRRSALTSAVVVFPLADGTVVETRTTIQIVEGSSVDTPLCNNHRMILRIRFSSHFNCVLPEDCEGTWRFFPTFGRSTTAVMPRAASSVGSPIPESISSIGVLMDPAETMTSRLALIS